MKKQRSIKSTSSSPKQKGKQHEIIEVPRSQRITQWMSVSFVVILGTLLVLSGLLLFLKVAT